MKRGGSALVALDLCASLVACDATLAPSHGESPFPFALDLTVPGSFGVNVWGDFPITDTARLRGVRHAGFSLVRTNLRWEDVDRGAAGFDFAAYDVFFRACRNLDLGVIFTLESKKPPRFEPHRSIRTADGRAAFARFAERAAERYAGDRTLWEVWNEPSNPHFWEPFPNAEEYVALVRATTRAIRERDPRAVVAGGASGLGLELQDLPWWREAIEAGLLDHVDALSVHPYQATHPPERAAVGLAELRRLVDEHAGGRELPFLNTEWGYSSVAHTGADLTELQAGYLAREFLVGLWQGLPVNIWFRWKDPPAATTPLYGLHTDEGEPKPALRVAETLLRTLSGYRYADRVAGFPQEIFVLRFVASDGDAFALWTSGSTRPVRLERSSGTGDLVDHVGRVQRLAWGDGGPTIQVRRWPVYLRVHR